MEKCREEDRWRDEEEKIGGEVKGEDRWRGVEGKIGGEVSRRR